MYSISRSGRIGIFSIVTKNLRLSVLSKKEAPLVTDYLVSNRKFHEVHSQTHDDSYFTVKTQKEYLAGDVREFRRGKLLPFWITLRDDPSKIIGKISFFNFAYGGMMCCTVGYHLDSEYEGKGIMREALCESVAFLIKECDIHRIEAYIMPDNVRSIKLIERAGFVYEGVKHSYMHINGSWEDHLCYYFLDKMLSNET